MYMQFRWTCTAWVNSVRTSRCIDPANRRTDWGICRYQEHQ